MKQIFRVGDTVYHWKYEKGEVICVDTEDFYSVKVRFEDDIKKAFTSEGLEVSYEPPTLSHTPYNFIEGGFFQRDPLPDIKKGTPIFVRNYNEDEWDKVRYDYMLSAVKLKIKQNKHIKEQLIPLRKEGYSFVEASLTDLIWGVGLEENNPLIVDKNNWKGTNLLGKAIDEALDLIIKDTQYE